jgi:urease accessory protein
VLTTPSATRVYRTDGEDAIQTVRLSIGPRGVVEWVPDHTIPFAGSAYRQTFDVEMDETARLILVDAFSAGRIGRGEAWRFAVLQSVVSVRDAHGWLLHDRFTLRGAIAGDAPAWDGLGFAESHPYFASIAVIGALDHERLAAEIQRRAASDGGARVGVATLPRRGALIRCLAPSAPELTDALESCWGLARRALLGLPPLALRKA